MPPAHPDLLAFSPPVKKREHEEKPPTHGLEHTMKDQSLTDLVRVLDVEVESAEYAHGECSWGFLLWVGLRTRVVAEGQYGDCGLSAVLRRDVWGAVCVGLQMG